MVTKFFEHSVWISAAMDRLGEHEASMWDEEDGFYYDVLRLPDGEATRLKVRSMVGLLPLAAVAIFEKTCCEKLPEVRAAARADSLRQHARAAPAMHRTWPRHSGRGAAGSMFVHCQRGQTAPHPRHGCWTRTSSSAPTASGRCRDYHQEHPYVFWHERPGVPGGVPAGGVGQRHVRRQFQLARAGVDAGQVMLIRALLQYWALLRRLDFKVECPTGSGQQMNLFEVAAGTGQRLIRIFLRGQQDGGRCTAAQRSSKPTRIGATASSSTSTSTATTARASAPATRPAGRAALPA